jgi:hypothetical protein
VLRWTLDVGRINGEEYARRLHVLGAILAIPDPPGQPTRYLVIRDLSKRPVIPQPEDLSQIGRIYWVDKEPDSVTRLARALQLKPIPDHFIAFFPEEFEQKLLRLELERASGRAEDDILETKFEIQVVGGRYEPRVVSQRYLR